MDLHTFVQQKKQSTITREACIFLGNPLNHSNSAQKTWQSGLKWNNISPTGRFPKKKSPCIFFPCPFRTKKAGVAENWYMTSNLGSRTNQGGEIRDPPTPFFNAKKICCWGKTWKKKSANGLWKSAQGFLFRLYSCTSYLMNLWTTTRTWLSWCPDVIWCCIAWICLSTKAIFKIKRLWLKT